MSKTTVSGRLRYGVLCFGLLLVGAETADAGTQFPGPIFEGDSDGDNFIVAQVSHQAGASFEVVANEVIVSLRGGYDSRAADMLAKGLGSEVRKVGENSGNLLLSVPSGRSLDDFLVQVRRAEGVLNASYNAVIEGSSEAATSCPTGVYDSYAWHPERLGFPRMCTDYGLTTDRSDVVVAVLDTGVAYENRVDHGYSFRLHPDLSNVDFVAANDIVGSDSHPNDDHGHGTHIASIIASSGKVVGIAPDTDIMPVKVLRWDRRGTEFDLVEGIHHAVLAGADIINMSLSFGPGYFPSSQLQMAIEAAVEAEVVMVASSGNYGHRGVLYPAAFPDVIGVGGTSIMKTPQGVLGDDLAPYSNYGAAVDLVAPGGDIYADENDDGWPDGVLAAAFGRNRPESPGYWFMAGTSQSAASVSGVTSWLLAAGAHPSDVRGALIGTAVDLGTSQSDVFYGAGQIDGYSAIKSVVSGEVTELPESHVSLYSYIQSDGDRGRQFVTEVQVVGAAGKPLSDVTVAGSYYGSVTELSMTAKTDKNGVALFVSDVVVPQGVGLAAGFQVEGVKDPLAALHSRPTGFYTLTPAFAELLSSVIASEKYEHSILLFETDPDSPYYRAAQGQGGDVVRSISMLPVGTGLRSGPLSIVFDEAFAPSLFGDAKGKTNLDELVFPGALSSGWGELKTYPGDVFEANEPNLGATASYLIVPIDRDMLRVDLSAGYPVITAPRSDYLDANRRFGDSLDQGSLGNGFASSVMGLGFASSTLGDGFASSTLGAGFASSTLGAGFASSTLGAGFASSTYGAGFASSTLGAGFASSPLGMSGDPVSELEGSSESEEGYELIE